MELVSLQRLIQGLATARGSGTNGYVQRNLSTLKRKSVPTQSAQEPIQRKPNQDILAHEHKRQIEIQCLELEDQLSLKQHSEQEIFEKVNQLRSQLLAQHQFQQQNVKKLQEHQIHQLAQAKEHANERFAKALKINHNEHVAGAAFDQEKQQLLKENRIRERQEREEARALAREQRNKVVVRERGTLYFLKTIDTTQARKRSPSLKERQRSPSLSPERRQTTRSPVHRSSRRSVSPSPVRRDRSQTPPRRSRNTARGRSRSVSRSPSRSTSSNSSQDRPSRRRSSRSVSVSSRSSYSSRRSRSSVSRSRSPPRRR